MSKSRQVLASAVIVVGFCTSASAVEVVYSQPPVNLPSDEERENATYSRVDATTGISLSKGLDNFTLTQDTEITDVH
jgi:hypothetical protein